MFKFSADVMTLFDKSKVVGKMIQDLSGKAAYVGIPEEDSQRGDTAYKAAKGRGPKGGVGSGSRSEEAGDAITNAQLLYIHTHGVRRKVMRDEMNPKIESGEMTYSQAYQMWIMSNGSPLWAVPPRPVIEPAIEHKKEFIAKQLRKALDAAMSGKDPTPELEKAGMLGQNIVRDWFVDPANGWPPNSPYTIKEKGSDKPLIDSGELRKAITYVVRSEE